MKNTDQLFFYDENYQEGDTVRQLFDQFDKHWKDANPKKSPLLLPTVSKVTQFSESNVLEKLLAEVNLSIFPFHHLICADSLFPWDDELRKIHLPAMREPEISDKKLRELYWQALAFNGISAKEAVLLDDINSAFVEEINGESVRFDWEVRYKNCLQGCAENYMREMFYCKRRIFEAGDDLRTILEINESVLVSNIPDEIAEYLRIRDPEELLVNSFGTQFTFSAKYKIQTDSEKDKKSLNIGSQRIRIIRNRIESYLFQRPKTAKKNRNGSYRFKLSDYWLDWQRAALLSKFDYDFIQYVLEAKVVRFYELTKLCRVTKTMKNGDELPKKLTIRYEKFIALMPLPKYHSEKEIKRQIEELTLLLKSGGYLKSFSIKHDLASGNDCQTTLVFTFND